MTKEEYNDEILLIKEQNDVELELYPLIGDIIAPTLHGLSKRYVFARKKSPLGQIYYGISSFPDIAILDNDFRNEKHKEINGDNWKKLRGCIEAKKFNSHLYELQELKDYIEEPVTKAGVIKVIDIGQLLGEILWYKKVLYTNGIEWKLFSTASYSEVDENTIINIVNKRIYLEADTKDSNYIWYKDETNYEWLKEIMNKIKEQTITKNCLDNWEEFISNMHNILKWT